MKKEDIEFFLDKVPFKIILTKGTIITVKEVIKLDDYVLTFKDKFNNITTQQLINISTAQEINNSKNTSSEGVGD